VAASPDVVDSALQSIEEGVRSRNLAVMLETLCAVVPEYQPSEALLRLLTSSPV
jgi:hypothetical protein